MDIITVTSKNFEDEVIKSKIDVLVDFNADWCGPCRMLKPILETLAKENENIKIVSINVDQEEDLAKKYSIFSIPCLIKFKNGIEVNRMVGLKSAKDIEKLINE